MQVGQMEDMDFERFFKAIDAISPESFKSFMGPISANEDSNA